MNRNDMKTSEEGQTPAPQEKQPGRQSEMWPRPQTIRPDYPASGRLQGRLAFITGGDSGIGRAVAVHFAREGCDVAIAYLEEDMDASDTRRMVEQEGRRCMLVPGDLGAPGAAEEAVQRAARALGGLDILVNNVARQFPTHDPGDLDEEQVADTFRTNVLTYYASTVAALEHLPKGSCIINTSSITGSRGHRTLLDYAGTKGAINAMTLSFASALAERGIRVNAVAPGPVWTPLIPASFSEEEMERFGDDTLLGRAGQPSEIAPAYVFLASRDASFITGHILHVNGGALLST